MNGNVFDPSMNFPIFSLWAFSYSCIVVLFLESDFSIRVMYFQFGRCIFILTYSDCHAMIPCICKFPVWTHILGKKRCMIVVHSHFLWPVVLKMQSSSFWFSWGFNHGFLTYLQWTLHSSDKPQAFYYHVIVKFQCCNSIYRHTKPNQDHATWKTGIK